MFQETAQTPPSDFKFCYFLAFQYYAVNQQNQSYLGFGNKVYYTNEELTNPFAVQRMIDDLCQIIGVTDICLQPWIELKDHKNYPLPDDLMRIPEPAEFDNCDGPSN